MEKAFEVSKVISKFSNKKIVIPGDKSLSIRWVLLSSLANGNSKAYNLLRSEDVRAAIEAVRKLGIKVILKSNECKIFGKGIDGYRYKKNTIIDAKNSGTLGRLLLGLIINTQNKIKLIGDNSLSKRDFRRITDPLSKFGVKFKLRKKNFLPLTITGTNKSKPITYFENKGSAQCKSSVIFAGFRTSGQTIIKAKKSRDHTELLCKYLKLPIKVIKGKNIDIIKVKKINYIPSLNYNIPSDISSAAFFIVLTVLTANSSLVLKNVNINPSRVGIITILKKMGAKINLRNIKTYKGEKIADISVYGSIDKLKKINCPSKFNSEAIDEFLLIFLVAAKAKGISKFKDLNELNQKESPRLVWGEKILNKIGIKTELKNDTLKIYGNPNVVVDRKITIKNFLKDHRVFMTSVIAAKCFGGKWFIYDKDSINTSFPNFLKLIKKLEK